MPSDEWLGGWLQVYPPGYIRQRYRSNDRLCGLPNVGCYCDETHQVRCQPVSDTEGAVTLWHVFGGWCQDVCACRIVYPLITFDAPKDLGDGGPKPGQCEILSGSDSCTTNADCGGNGCQCTAWPTTLTGADGGEHYQTTCAPPAVLPRAEMQRKDLLETSHDPTACACNVTYVSRACCSAANGLVWEGPEKKLGELNYTP